jgi:putative pyruvate formate lyase activating enzyme
MNKNTDLKLSAIKPGQYDSLLEPLQNCKICPRKCGADRFSGKGGYCKSDTSFYISSICVHRGEEPPVSGSAGICNVFFGHCNLQCVYCQNHQISNNSESGAARRMPLNQVLREIIHCLDLGCRGVGFVSPSHFIPQMKIIIHALHDLGFYPTIVYNTNGYDTVETLKDIAPLVDVYLPDFKYMSRDLSRRYSDAADYPEVAKEALKEMFRQKGSLLLTGDDALAERGILIRHLVLPGCIENSKEVLRFIADEISTSVHISLMSQYHPTFQVSDVPPLNRTLIQEEYFRVVDEFYRLGFRNGFIQDMDSYDSYRPDFDKSHPFES